MESVADCKAFRNGLYSGLKYAFTGAYVYYQDLQADLFHAVKNFGNWGGPYYSYNVTASDDAASGIWFGLYGYIGNANFLIAGTEKLLASGTLDESDTQTVQQYYGEACYIRAHLLFNLTQYFCEDYDPETAGNQWTDSQKERAKLLFHRFPRLKEAYSLTHSLRMIFSNPQATAESARESILRWCQKAVAFQNKHFATVVHTIEARLEDILHYFDERHTNAYAESLNAKIKTFRAALRGVKDVKFFLYRLSTIFS